MQIFVIFLSYRRTLLDLSVSADQQAQPWEDFVPLEGTGDMLEGVTRIPVQITILPVS